jgi:hypothetical protein
MHIQKGKTDFVPVMIFVLQMYMINMWDTLDLEIILIKTLIKTMEQ